MGRHTIKIIYCPGSEVVEVQFEILGNILTTLCAPTGQFNEIKLQQSRERHEFIYIYRKNKKKHVNIATSSLESNHIVSA